MNRHDRSLNIDMEAFNSMRVMSFTHNLEGHPLLTLPSLIELAKRHEPKGLIRYHAGNVKPSTNFESAPTQHATGLTVMETLADMERSGSWVAFHFLHRDPIYRELSRSILEEVRPLIGKHEREMTNFTGWIFVTSPGGVTPFHIDHEHNFLMQIQGKKRLNVWEPQNREVISHRALELFHCNSSRKEVVYRDEFQVSAHEFDAVPGMGVYMPTTAPHWVKNGSEVSITLSVTFTTASTLRKERVYTANHMMRLRGLNPTPFGTSRMKDNFKAALVGSYIGAKRRFKRAPLAPYLIQT